MKKKKKREKKDRQQEEQNQAFPESVSVPDLESDALLRRAVSLVGGKWKLRVLWALRDGGSVRYGEIRKRVPEITDMMLSQSLRELTEDGLIGRQQYREIPPRVEYALTDAGADLLPVLKLMCEWAMKRER